MFIISPVTCTADARPPRSAGRSLEFAEDLQKVIHRDKLRSVAAGKLGDACYRQRRAEDVDDAVQEVRRSRALEQQHRAVERSQSRRVIPMRENRRTLQQ